MWVSHSVFSVWYAQHLGPVCTAIMHLRPWREWHLLEILSMDRTGSTSRWIFRNTLLWSSPVHKKSYASRASAWFTAHWRFLEKYGPIFVILLHVDSIRRFHYRSSNHRSLIIWCSERCLRVETSFLCISIPSYNTNIDNVHLHIYFHHQHSINKGWTHCTTLQ